MLETSTIEMSLKKTEGLIRLMRPRQWIKNSFVLAPLIFTGKFLNFTSVSHALIAAVLFCIASSVTYIINDMHDIKHDQHHPIKSKSRPLAAGMVSMHIASILLAGLCLLLISGWFLAPNTMLVITAYLALSISYTFFLKHQPVIDIFAIAIGFVLRVYGGATALDVPVSSWMFVTTLCLALYLAAIKRRQELRQNGSKGRKVLEKYSITLVDRYAEMSATGALVFYSMFVMSAKSELIITIPLVLFGIFRYWFVVEHFDSGESPTDALLADWQLLVTVALWLAICAWALWPN